MDPNDWLKERLDISRKIRGTLVGFYIDLGRLQIIVSPFRTTLKGQLKTLPGCHMKLSGQVIEEMARTLSRIPNVRNVRLEFDNWFQESHGGPWREGDAAQSMVKSKQLKKRDIQGSTYSMKRKGFSDSAPSDAASE